MLTYLEQLTNGQVFQNFEILNSKMVWSILNVFKDKKAPAKPVRQDPRRGGKAGPPAGSQRIPKASRL